MSQVWKKWRREILLGLAILLTAFFIRIFNLTILPVFADEAIYIRWSQVMQSVPSLRFIPLSDGKQPLFMWLVIPFLKIFDDPLFAGRFVSVLTGMGTLVGTFVLTFLLYRSVKVSLAAAFIFALSSFSVFFDRLALADSMLTFFGMWTLIFSILVVRTLRLDSAMIAGFALGGALLTKSPAIYFVLMLPLTLLVSSWTKKVKNIFKLAGSYIFLFGVTILIGFGLYSILRLGPEFHMIAIRNKDYVYPIGHILTSPFDPLKPFLHRIWEYLLILGPSALTALFLYGVYRGFKSFPRETLLLLLWATLPMIASAEFSKTMTARYVYFSVPYIFSLASASLLRINEKQKSLGVDSFRHRGGTALAAKLLILLFSIQSLYTNFRLLTDPQKAYLPRSERSGYLEEWTSGYGIKDVSEILNEESKKIPEGTQIVVGTEGHFGTLPDGLQIYLNQNSKVTVIGVGQPIWSTPDSLKESKSFGNKTYLVVNDSRFFGDMDTLGLKLLNSYSKATKPDGSKESLLFFELN